MTREKIRIARKNKIVKLFAADEKLFTNQVAVRASIVWPVADGLLQELVEEGRLAGDKINGYFVPVEKSSKLGRLKSFFHIFA